MFLKSMHCKLLLGFLLLYIATIITLQFTWFELLLMTFIISVIGFPITLVLAGRKFAKRPFNNFGTWFGVVFIGIVLFHVAGQDDKWLLITLLHFDLPYKVLLDNDQLADMTLGIITPLGLLVRVLLGAAYGFVIDIVLFLYNQAKKRWYRWGN